MISVFMAIGISFLTGWCLIDTLWPHRAEPSGTTVFRVALSLMLGLAVSSAVSFACLWAGWTVSPTSPAADGATLAAALILRWRRRLNAPLMEPFLGDAVLTQARSHLVIAVQWALVATTMTILGLTIFCQASLYRGDPHGQWDAFAIWNLRARFLFRGGADWQRAFNSSLAWSHTDYPLLLPLTVARLWGYLGTDDPIVPGATGIGFTVLAVLTLFGALSWQGGIGRAALAAVFLLTSTLFDEQGALQCADVPLACFMLAALAMAAGCVRGPKSAPGHAILAGLFAGGAAWTKNEGLLFCLALGVCFWSAVRWKRGTVEARAAIGRMIAGMAPFLACVGLMKLLVAGGNDLVASMSPASILSRLMDGDRHRLILYWVWNTWRGNIDWTALLLLSGYLLTTVTACRTAVANCNRECVVSAVFLASVLVLLQAGYYFAYLNSPYDLRWHLTSSAHRLLVQTWPSVILLLFFVVPSPESAVTALLKPAGSQAPRSREAKSESSSSPPTC